MPPPRVSKHGYAGVYAHNDGRQFAARITVDGVKKYIGSYATAEGAARAYDEMARGILGSRARLNFPNDGEMSRAQRRSERAC